MATAFRSLAFFFSLALTTTVSSAQSPSALDPAPIQPQSSAQTADQFSVSTGAEQWRLDEAPPARAVLFAGRRISLGERKVTESLAKDGKRQLLFPINWYGPYQAQATDIRSISVRYEGAKASMIVIDYVPERLAMPKAGFKHEGGASRYYRDMAVVRQGGRMLVKQAIANGAEDGKGNLWIDAIVIYAIDDAPAPGASATTTATP